MKRMLRSICARTDGLLVGGSQIQRAFAYSASIRVISEYSASIRVDSEYSASIQRVFG